MAPDSAWMPMSAVPPSPAKPTTVKPFSPFRFMPAATPVMRLAVPANVEIIALQPNASCGKLKPTADMQPAGRIAMARSPSTLSAMRTASEPPHPAHALWPKNGSSLLIRLSARAMSHPHSQKRVARGIAAVDHRREHRVDIVCRDVAPAQASDVAEGLGQLAGKAIVL